MHPLYRPPQPEEPDETPASGSKELYIRAALWHAAQAMIQLYAELGGEHVDEVMSTWAQDGPYDDPPEDAESLYEKLELMDLWIEELDI